MQSAECMVSAGCRGPHLEREVSTGEDAAGPLCRAAGLQASSSWPAPPYGEPGAATEALWSMGSAQERRSGQLLVLEEQLIAPVFPEHSRRDEDVSAQACSAILQQLCTLTIGGGRRA